MSAERKTIHQIIIDVARHFHVSEESIRGPSHEREAVRPRHVAMYLARRTGASWPKIGRMFGGRDHTTVLHAVRQMEHRMAADPELARVVALLSEEAPASHFTEAEILSARLEHLKRTMVVTRRAITMASKSLVTIDAAVAEIRGQLENRTEVNHV